MMRPGLLFYICKPPYILYINQKLRGQKHQVVPNGEIKPGFPDYKTSVLFTVPRLQLFCSYLNLGSHTIVKSQFILNKTEESSSLGTGRRNKRKIFWRTMSKNSVCQTLHNMSVRNKHWLYKHVIQIDLDFQVWLSLSPKNVLIHFDV